MANKTNYFAALIQNAIFQNSSAAQAEIGAMVPAIAFFTAGISATSSQVGVGNTEATGTGYARIAAATIAAAFGTAASGNPSVITNDGALTTAAVGAGGWGTITSWALVDITPATDTILLFATGYNLTPTSGQTLQWAVGNLSLTET